MIALPRRECQLQAVHPGGRGSAEYAHGEDDMDGLGELMPLDSKLKFPDRDETRKLGVFLEQRLDKDYGNKHCDMPLLGPLTHVDAWTVMFYAS